MLKKTASGFILSVYAQPNGKKSEILGLHDGHLKIRLKAPPVEGQANAALEEFIAKFFGCARKNVSLIRGQQSRQKAVEVTGLSYELAEAALKKFL